MKTIRDLKKEIEEAHKEIYDYMLETQDKKLRAKYFKLVYPLSDLLNIIGSKGVAEYQPPLTDKQLDNALNLK